MKIPEVERMKLGCWNSKELLLLFIPPVFIDTEDAKFTLVLIVKELIKEVK